jgi:hypothetical protein
MTQSQQGGNGLEEKLAKATVDVEAKRRLYLAALEYRDQAVVDLYDAGEPIRAVCAISHLSAARVNQIVARNG